MSRARQLTLALLVSAAAARRAVRASAAATRRSIRRCAFASLAHRALSSSTSIRAKIAWPRGWRRSPKRRGATLRAAARRRRRRALTHVVLADQTELANGWATPLPYNTIVIYAAWPSGSEFIGNTDDWLRLVFTHEFTHIVHLDRSEGWARVVRGVFGRIAARVSRICSCRRGRSKGWRPTRRARSPARAGCTPATSARSSAKRRAQRRLEPLDRVNGGLTDWPGGQARVRVRRRLPRVSRRPLRRRQARRRSPTRRRAACRTPRRRSFTQGLRRVARRPLARLSGKRCRSGGASRSPHR